MTVAVITIVHGRHPHVARQLRALETSTRLPDRYVVVAIDDPSVRRVVAGGPLPTTVVDLPTTPLGLPLAAARNAGAAHAIAAGADTLVFLDADCLPSRSLVGAYERFARDRRTAGLLLCGPVAYLPEGLDPDLGPDVLESRSSPHPARPAPPRGAIEVGADHALFWSLSFALSTPLWQRIGGFCEDFVGYGGEDTDFAQSAREAGVDLAFVGDAPAFHQYHPTQNPPVQHVADIVRNANLYRRRRGAFPMTGWLAEFERRGLVALTPDGAEYATV